MDLSQGNCFSYSLQHRMENQSWINESRTHHQEEEKMVKQEQETTKTVPESSRNREDKGEQLIYEVH